MTTLRIDLNADMGEYSTPAQRDVEAALMPLVSSCNIACGGHAGDEETMRVTAQLATKHAVSIGAHPAYPDREGFGRRSMGIEASTLRQSLIDQMTALQTILDSEEASLAHVKPHGALYNDAARDPSLARLVVGATGKATLVGQPGSALEQAAREANRPFAAEGFIDRLYQASGALTPRSLDGAVIGDVGARVAQARAIARKEEVSAADGTLRLDVKTLCIHSDSPSAVETAQCLRDTLEADGFEICAF